VAIETYAQAQGYGLPKELYFVDEAVSGAKLDRPGLDRLRDQASEGVYQAVICLSPDRLARQYALQVLLLEEFRRAGLQVLFVNQPPVSDDPQGQLLLGIQGLFAEYERALITERMRRGRLHCARQGRMVSPQTPYGYRYVPKDEPNGGHWEIEECEAATVRQIFAWYTQTEPVSIYEITTRLEAQRSDYPPRQAKRWYPSSVGNILRQCQYTGYAYYNRTQNVSQEVGQLRRAGHGKRKAVGRRLRPTEEWITIPTSAIIDQETWQIAQERLTMNQKTAPRNNKRHTYHLRGLLVCATCGHTLIGRTYKGQASYSCTYGMGCCAPDLPTHSCTIAENLIEPLIWHAVVELLQHPKLMVQAWQTTGADQIAFVEQGEQERLEKRLRFLDRQKERLLDLFQEEQLDKFVYLERKQCLEQEQLVIQTRLQPFDQHTRLEQSKEQVIAKFELYCQRIQANLANPTAELKQEVIRLLIDHVVVGNGEIVIKHIVPTDDDCRLQPQRKFADK
jgi:site-specific DNA recombinase